MDEIRHDVQDEIHFVNYIMLRRVYDVLLGLYSNVNGREANALAQLHEAGGFASPEPAITYDESDDTEEV